MLKSVGSVLLGSDGAAFESPTLVLLNDIFSISDADIQTALSPVVKSLQKTFSVEQGSLAEIIGEPIDYKWLFDMYGLLQGAEIWDTLGDWVENSQPVLGPTAKSNLMTFAKGADRSRVQACIEKKKHFAKRLNDFLGDKKLLCFPTVPILAPLRGSIEAESRRAGVYYPRMLAVNAIAGLSGTPQITMPVADVNGVPIGISLLAGYGQDEKLLSFAGAI